MSLLDRKSFARDLLVLFLVGVIVASLFSTGVAVTTDKYFARAVSGVLGDYGQYDLVFQVRTELFGETQRQLQRIVAERFPGSRLHAGVSLAGKSTIFLSLASPYRTREVFESLYYYFGSLPGNAGFSLIAEPRLVLSAVPGGAQEMLQRVLGRLPGVAFVFVDGDNLNVLLRSAREMERVREQVEQAIARYQILEVHFSADASLRDTADLGNRMEKALREVPGLTMAKDVTSGGSGGDAQSMSSTLNELRRFMVSYAARIVLTPASGETLHPGERFVLQGQAKRPPAPGQPKDDLFIEIKLESVRNGLGEGLIIRGDASHIENTMAYRLLPGEKVGGRAGAVGVIDERSALASALDEGANLLGLVKEMAGDPVWGDASGSLRAYQGILGEIAGVQRLLTAVRDGMSASTAAQTRDKLQQAAAQIEAVSDDLRFLAATTARIKVAENKISSLLERVGFFQSLLRGQIQRHLNQEELGGPLLAADQGLTALWENLRRRARQIDDFVNRFNPLVQVLLGWGERARALSEQLEGFGGAMAPGSEARRTFDALFGATQSVLSKLEGTGTLGLAGGIGQAQAGLSALGGFDLDGLIEQMRYVRDSLPQLMDEEIGRSVGLIDRYLGGSGTSGQRIQIMINSGADRNAAAGAVSRASGRGRARISILPLCSLEPDFRGEIFRVLGEVRTTITALILLCLFILEFLLDQTAILVMLRRQAEAVGKRVAGSHSRLARLVSIVLDPARLYAAGFGGFWLWLCFVLTGARLPLVGSWGAALLGAFLGLALGSLAERINPINADEVMAGESLGLPFVIIMREIVIPSGRPGLLQLLNRRRLIMRGGGG